MEWERIFGRRARMRFWNEMKFGNRLHEFNRIIVVMRSVIKKFVEINHHGTKNLRMSNSDF